MLRQLPVLIKEGENSNYRKKRIAVHPSQIAFIEEISSKQCNIVVEFEMKTCIYLCPKPFEYLYNFTNLSPYNLFIEN